MDDEQRSPAGLTRYTHEHFDQAYSRIRRGALAWYKWFPQSGLNIASVEQISESDALAAGWAPLTADALRGIAPQLMDAYWAAMRIRGLDGVWSNGAAATRHAQQVMRALTECVAKLLDAEATPAQSVTVATVAGLLALRAAVDEALRGSGGDAPGSPPSTEAVDALARALRGVIEVERKHDRWRQQRALQQVAVGDKHARAFAYQVAHEVLLKYAPADGKGAEGAA